MSSRSYDVVVVGAGVFGVWIAYRLQSGGRRVAIVDAYGAANSRASSGGESRIIRMGYGADEIYTRWAAQALDRWKQVLGRISPPLFVETGVLWFATPDDAHVGASERVLERVGIPTRRLSRDALAKHYPQVGLDGVAWGLLEPESGVLLARQAVRLLLQEAVKVGAAFYHANVPPASDQEGLHRVRTTDGHELIAPVVVFACGPWLPDLFPDLLEGRIQATRQEVFFFGPPRGDVRFAPPLMPAWVDFPREAYGIPDLEGRGFKVGLDRHGPKFDPDAGHRLASAAGLEEARRLLARRFPDLRDAPLIESRVCQYENTATGDFLIDRHPRDPDVWLVGGGSGHGFKHGPTVADYLVDRLGDGQPVDRRFALAGKETVRLRQVY